MRFFPDKSHKKISSVAFDCCHAVIAGKGLLILALCYIICLLHFSENGCIGEAGFGRCEQSAIQVTSIIPFANVTHRYFSIKRWVSLTLISNKFWMTTQSVFIMGTVAVTAGANFCLLYIIFSLNYKETESMSIQRKEKLKRIHSLFNQGWGNSSKFHENENATSEALSLLQTPDELKIRRKSRSGKYFFPQAERYEDDEDEFVGRGKSKYISLPKIIPSSIEDINDNDDLDTANGSDMDDDSTEIKSEERVGSVLLRSLLKNLVTVERDFISNLKSDKRKSNRFGKNVNELQSLFLSSGSNENENVGKKGKGSLLITRDVFSNKYRKEEEALRRQILERVEELDPLMCLPKVLCGYSSRQGRQKNNYYSLQKPKKTTSAVTKRPQASSHSNESGLIDDYIKLLKIVQSSDSSEKLSSTKSKKKKVIAEKKKPVKGSNKKKPNSQKGHYNDEAEDDGFSSRSGSESSEESNESDELPQYEITRPPTPPTRYKQPRPPKQSEFNKFLYGTKGQKKKKKKKKKKIEEEEDEEEEEEEDEQHDFDEIFDDDHRKYLEEKAKMNKLMYTSGPSSSENWWAPFDASQELHYDYKYPVIKGPKPATSLYDPLNTESEFSSYQGGITGWFKNMFENLTPKFSWDGWGYGANEFKNDPFFDDFKRRSLTSLGNNRRKARGNQMNNLSRNTTSKNISEKKLGVGDNRNGKAMKLGVERKMKFAVESNEPVGENEKEVDPAEKFRVAVEIGKRLTSPAQCDFIYNGCPLSYEEILLVINEPMKQTSGQFFHTKTTTTQKPKPAPIVRNKGSYIAYPTHNYFQFTTAPSQYGSLPYAFSPTIQQNPYAYPTQQQQQPNSYHHYSHNVMPMPQQPISYLYNQNFQHQQQREQFQYNQQHPRQPQYHSHSQHQQDFSQQNKLDEFMAHVVGIDGNSVTASTASPAIHHPHQTRIQQALPSGEQFEINLSYSDKNRNRNSMEIDRTGLTPLSGSQEAEETAGSNLQPFSEDGEGSDPKPGENDENQFVHKILQYPHYEFSSNQYKIRRKDNIQTDHEKEGEEDDEKEIWKGGLVDIARNKVVKISNTSTNDVSLSSSLASTSAEDSYKNGTEPATWNLSPFAQALTEGINITLPNPVPIANKSAGKDVPTKTSKKKEKLSKYKEMLKGAFSISSVAATSAPTKRQTTQKLAVVLPLSSSLKPSLFLKSGSKTKKSKGKSDPTRISLSSRRKKDKKSTKIGIDHKKKKGAQKGKDDNVDSNDNSGSNENDNSSSDRDSGSNISNGSSSSYGSSSSSSNENKTQEKRRKTIGKNGRKQKDEKKKLEKDRNREKADSSSNRIRSSKKNKGKSTKMENKPHLHKQSPESIQAKKRADRKKKGGNSSTSSSHNNGIYPVYGSSYYSPPYAPGAGGYLHHHHRPPPPPTSTVASFFSYWFG